MGETSMIPVSGSLAPAEGQMKRLEIATGTMPVASGYIPTDAPMVPVRVTTSGQQIVFRLDVEQLRRQREIEEANEEIRRRLRS